MSSKHANEGSIPSGESILSDDDLVLVRRGDLFSAMEGCATAYGASAKRPNDTYILTWFERLDKAVNSPSSRKDEADVPNVSAGGSNPPEGTILDRSVA